MIRSAAEGCQVAGESVSIPASEKAEDATRAKILAAAMQCFLQLGIAKTSLQDVARAADMSRGTVYRYFADRRTLIDATIEQNVVNYYDEATEAMALATTLAAQIGAFGEVFARNVAENRRHDVVTDESELLRLLATDLDGGLRRMSTFLAPYVVQAKERGELAPDVEEDEASELLALDAHDTDRDAVVDCLRHATTAHRRPVPRALCSRRFGCRTHTTLIGRNSSSHSDAEPLQSKYSPPFASRMCPVIARDRSDNRNTAASAYSSGAGSRRSAMFAV